MLGDRIENLTVAYDDGKVALGGLVDSYATKQKSVLLAGSGLTVGAWAVAPGNNGLFFYSKTGADATPFQGGFLCAAAPVQRTFGMNSGGSGPSCGGSENTG